jgi:hypothetical protein
MEFCLWGNAVSLMCFSAHFKNDILGKKILIRECYHGSVIPLVRF